MFWAEMTEHGVRGHYAVQVERMGNAGAVKLCFPLFDESVYRDAEHVAVLYADMPCWRSSTIRTLIERHTETEAVLSIFQIDLDQPGCPDEVKKTPI